MSDDMKSVIVPKSDQLNADDLISGPITINITGVTIKDGEQPISIHYEGDNGKPYKCCKSMARILVYAWGADSKKYAGRSMTLYRDPSVKWAGMEVGGIRISHLSDIDTAMTMALTMTRSNRKPFTVKPLVASGKTTENPREGGRAEESSADQTVGASDSHAGNPVTGSDSGRALPGTGSQLIDDADESALLDLLTANGVELSALLSVSRLKRLRDLTKSRLQGAKDWIKAQKVPA